MRPELTSWWRFNSRTIFRNGAAQRLDEPCDLELGVVLRRIEPPFRQGLTDRATNRRRARLRVARNQLNAVADTSRSKYVSRRSSKASRTFLPETRLRAYSEVGFGPSAAQQEMARDSNIGVRGRNGRVRHELRRQPADRLLVAK
jgi:hypothetical protein